MPVLLGGCTKVRQFCVAISPACETGSVSALRVVSSGLPGRDGLRVPASTRAHVHQQFNFVSSSLRFAAMALAPTRGCYWVNVKTVLPDDHIPTLHSLQLTLRRVTIAGEGEEVPQLQVLAAGPQVRLLGRCSQQSVLAATFRANVVVEPSVWDVPCTTTVIAAQGLQRTVFALKRGGTQELAHLGGPDGKRLRLFDSLPELVPGLRRWRHAGATPRPPAAQAESSVGSVHAMTTAVLAHYERHFGVRRAQTPGKAVAS